jgi:DMSO/TMAO reductase YedYZ molybdopterin-dependent catalytic subunit
MTLTIIGANGTSVVLHEGDIGSFTSYTAYGGFKNSLGNLKGLGYYTGVPINTLCNLVGGVHYGQTLFVNASDGYKMNFTYEQVNGDFVTYNNKTGQQESHNKTLTTMLAYYLNGVNLTSDQGGPLRFVIVGPEGLCTDSTYWVKYVVKLQVYKTPGDVNGDGVIDCKDLRRIGKGFGATTGQPLYDRDADVNSDGIIDRSDLKILARNFGQ